MKQFVRESLFVVSILFVCKSSANLDYAVRFNNISCTSCHFSPSGGGPLKREGKIFLNRWFDTTPTDLQNFVSANFRALAYFPKKPETTKGGLGVMSSGMALHVPLSEKKDTHLVIENNIAGFSAAPLRDTYLLYSFASPGTYQWYDSLLVGRFRAPFGIATDEHRTYTRLATGTRWYDFETGVLFSGTPSSQIHFDVGLVNGKNFSGQALNAGQEREWGTLLNIRYMPSFFLVGLSSNQYKMQKAEDSSHAWSLYSVVSLLRMNSLLMPTSLKLEYARAQGFNSILSQGLASDPNYIATLKSSSSKSILARMDWLLSNTFNLIYKFDWLMPDSEFPSDTYSRHGIGFRWMLTANTNLSVRTEFAQARHPSENIKSGQLAQDATFLILEGVF